MKQWLYRTAGNDDEGDPIDFGVVVADNFDEAVERVSKQLVGCVGVDPGGEMVYFYEVTGYENGIMQTKPRGEVVVELPREGDSDDPDGPWGGGFASNH